MRGAVSDFWGKLRFDATGRVAEWHPLWHHCADVAACAEVLLADSLMGRRLAHTLGIEALSQRQRARLVALAALHDLGKTNRGFQLRSRGPKVRGAGHVDEALALLEGMRQRGELAQAAAKLVGPVFGWGPGTPALMIASICHHGRPRLAEARAQAAVLRGWWHPQGEFEPVVGLQTLWGHVRGWLPEAWGPGVDLPDVAAFTHAFSGLVMLADWLGSDTDLFPYAEAGETPAARFEWARGRARDALAAVGATTNTLREVSAISPIGIGHVGPGFTDARPLQQAILDRPLPPPAGSTVVLEAETGSGKTEAALLHFLRLFAAGRVDGLYFALPTRTSAVQIHGRVHQAITTTFGREAPGTVLAVPGYLRVDATEGQREARFDVRWPAPLATPDHLWPDDERERYEWRFWAAEHAKRYLAGAVVVGTVDQALLSGLQVRHAHLRAAGLSRLLLVVDEVHASDAYMTRVLSNVLRRHRAAGGHALLLSATLGAHARATLLGQASDPDLESASSAPYPALTSDRDAEPQPIPRDDTQGKVVQIEQWPTPTPEAIAARALAAAEQGARVLIIRNTVRACIATQRALAAQAQTLVRVLSVAGRAVPHHARFAPADRRRLDAAVEGAFGKAADPRGGVVAVATQTVEQSLDLDADLLLTDLAPMDVLLQRIGRLHRHRGRDTHRPPGFAEARCVVFEPGPLTPHADGRLRAGDGLGSVYADGRVLEATRRNLGRAPEVRIPAENRARVEAAVHPRVLRAIEGESPMWRKHGEHIRGEHLGARLAADLNLLDERQPYLDCQFPADRRIGARLGTPALRFELPGAPVAGPLGPICEIRVAAWQLPDDFGPPDDATVEVTPRPDGLALTLTGETHERFLYTALGLQEDA